MTQVDLDGSGTTLPATPPSTARQQRLVELAPSDLRLAGLDASRSRKKGAEAMIALRPIQARAVRARSPTR